MKHLRIMSIIIFLLLNRHCLIFHYQLPIATFSYLAYYTTNFFNPNFQLLVLCIQFSFLISQPYNHIPYSTFYLIIILFKKLVG